MDLDQHHTSRRLGLAGLVLAALTLTGGGIAGAATVTPLSTNLVRNAGAEDGPSGAGEPVASVPGWTVRGSGTVVWYGAPGFPAYAHGMTFGGGNNLFFCGPGASTRFGQLIRITGRDGLIDAGGASIGLSLRVGSKGIQGDYGRGQVVFLDAAKHKLGSATTPTKQGTNGKLELLSIGVAVPVGTRYVRLFLQGKRFVDTVCDVYFDTVDLRLYS